MAPKKNKGKRKEPERSTSRAQRLPAKFIHFQYDVVANHTYGDLLQRIRDTLGSSELHGVKVLPPPIVDGKRQYIRLEFRERDVPQCAIFLRATDLYIVGYETQNGIIKELKPDDGKEYELIDEVAQLSSEVTRRLPDNVLPFTCSYSQLVTASTLSKKNSIPIHFGALSTSVTKLALPSTPGAEIATSILVMICIFPEAIRFRNIEKKVVSSTESQGNWTLGNELSEWTIKWSKVSKVIRTGEKGPNAVLKSYNLVVNFDEVKSLVLENVEDAKKIIAIMLHEPDSR